jgi:DHA1 family bicyclomycin/chloramphenicol resistance-like MFS transporter
VTARGLPSDRLLILLLAAVTAAGPVTMNLYVPALPAIQTHFGATLAEINATLSLALAAFALGVLAFGPLSDRIGRRPVMIAGQLVFALGNLLCLLSPSLEVLLAGRVVQALGSSAGVVVARAVLADVYGRERMARMLAYMTMIMVIGPTTAPLVGGVLTETFGWHSLFAALLGVSLLTLALTWRLLPETRSQADSEANTSLLDSAGALLRQRKFVDFAAQASCIYALFLGFISVAPYVLANMGYPASTYGAWYLAVAGGYFLGNWLTTRYAVKLGLERLIRIGVSIQLVSAAAGAGLVLAGWWTPAALFLPMGVLGFGQGLILPNITASAVALAPRTPGVASSLLGFGQQVVGAVSVQSLAMLPIDTPVPLYLFTLAIAAIAWLWLMLERRPAVS